jgi:hypothetical protein
MFFKNKHPSVGYAYGVLTGAYVGEMLVCVEYDKDVCKFISIPKNINREVPREKFDFGLNSKIVEPVEKLPKGVFKILEKQYKYNLNNNL